MRHTVYTFALLTALALPASAHAQIVWDGPSLVSPASPLGLSILLLSPHPGDGLGVLATWRQDRGSVGRGYRAAIGEGASGDIAVSAGVDVGGLLTRGLERSEIDVMWWSGLGAGVGDEFVVSVPLGLVAGWTGVGDDAVFSPYAGAHVVLDLASGDGDAATFDAAFDLGLDLALTSGWLVRFGATLGDRDALALGIRVPSGPVLPSGPVRGN